MNRPWKLVLGLGLSALALAFSASAAPSAPGRASDAIRSGHRGDGAGEAAAIQSRIDRAHQNWTAGQTSLLELDAAGRARYRMSGPLPLPVSGRRAPFQDRDFSGMDLPPQLDWRDHGGDFVTPVRDQGSCGAGWAYAATAALESAFLLGYGAGDLRDFDLSERQLVECMPGYGFAVSCEGGLASDVFWFAENIGLLQECCLPWDVQVRDACGGGLCPDPEMRLTRFSESGAVCYRADLYAIRRALLVFGPLLSSMQTYPSLDAYRAGLYRPLPGEKPDGVQSVLIVGYDSLRRAWLVKNSWGGDWGESGFAWISWDSRTRLGDWTYWTRFDPLDRGPLAAFVVSPSRPRAGEPCRFEDRSVSASGEIVDREWDFDGDGVIDAEGPGPYLHTFERSGRYSPLLRVTDQDGRIDEDHPLGLLQVVYDGPRWVVDADRGSPYGEGSPSRPFLRVQSALDAAAPGDTVLLRPGIYEGVLNTELRLGEIVLRGEGELGEAVLDGGGRSRILELIPGEGSGPLIRNLVLRDGFHPERGAAVLAAGASLRFENCRFESNETGGDSSRGGAVWGDRAMVFEHCVFKGNRAKASAGALYAEGLLSLSACRFEDNASAGDGGALALGPGARADIVNSVFLANEAVRGGALFGAEASAGLLHLSATANVAGDSGGFLCWNGGSVEIANSILWGDSAAREAEIRTSETQVDLGVCLIAGFGEKGLFDVDPLFADAAAGDLRLLSASACLGVGEDLGLGVDFEGRPRPNPQGSSPDLGAYEAEGRAGPVEASEPLAFSFEGIYPNPFNPTTTVLFRLEEAAEVKADIYLPTGQWVATLLAQALGAGDHRLSWTAVDELGEPLPSGVFLVRIECRYADGRVESDYRKAILVK